MKNNIIASIALFQSLYDNGKLDIFSVIAKFVQSTIQMNNLYSFDTNQLKSQLKNDFEIEIPESVIRTVLKKRLSNEVSKDNNGGYVANIASLEVNKFNEELERQTSKCQQVFNLLFEFYESINGKPVPQNEKAELIDSFADFLLKSPKEHEECFFSQFIFANENKKAFLENLNEIREGYIIVQGVKDITDSTDINSIGSWDSKLTIYLDTEHLFSSFGYNGDLYKNVFDDFFSLVKEANRKEKFIELKYFEETQKSIESYFNAAIMIKEGRIRPRAEVAMNVILSKCNEPSDVFTEKAKFLSHLKTHNICCDKRDNVVSERITNVENDSILATIIRDAAEKWPNVDEDTVIKYLRQFSIINHIRCGNNKTSFERCRCILMTANGIASFITWHPLIKDEKSFTYASDIDFITSRLWFKLHKGLIKGKRPISFNIVTKTKLIMTSLLYKSASNKYDELNNSNYSKDEEISMYNSIREHEILPEQINSTNITEIIDFINVKNIEDLRREKSALLVKAKKGEAALIELKKIKFEEQQKRKEQIRKKWKRKEFMHILLYSIICLFFSSLIYLAIYMIKSPNDTCIGTIGFLISCIVIPILTYTVKPIKQRIVSYIRRKKMHFFKHYLK
jgi:hypothetical protein